MENVKALPELRFPHYVDEWKKEKVKDLFLLISGQHLNPDEYTTTLTTSSPYFTGPSDFTNNEKEVTKWSLKGGKEAIERDVLFTVKGSGVGTMLFLNLPKVVIGRQLMAIRSSKASSSLLFHYLSTHKQYYQALASGNMIPGLSRDDILNTKICFPSLSEQQKIGSFLTSVDTKIQQFSKKKALLEQYKKGVMQQIFIQEMRFKDDEGKDYPEWEESSLGEHIDLVSGFAFKGEDISEKVGGVLLMRGINITEGFIRHNKDVDRYFHGDQRKLELLKVKEGDLVLPMDGSKVGKNSALVTAVDEGSLLVQRVARIRSLNSSHILFIYQQIRSPKFYRYVDMVNTSSGIPHISAKQIKDFIISFPVYEEQYKIASFLSKLDRKIDLVSRQLYKTQEFKKGLLQRMFV